MRALYESINHKALDSTQIGKCMFSAHSATLLKIIHSIAPVLTYFNSIDNGSGWSKA